MAQPGSVLRGQDFVVAATISTHHLWKQVREIGGAYGSGFAFDATGVFCFTSFRDPQLLNTLNAYKETPQFLKQWAQTMTQDEVTRAIIAVLRDVDGPLPTDQKGTKSFWQLIARQTEEDRKTFRQEVSSQGFNLSIHHSFSFELPLTVFIAISGFDSCRLLSAPACADSRVSIAIAARRARFLCSFLCFYVVLHLDAEYYPGGLRLVR